MLYWNLKNNGEKWNNKVKSETYSSYISSKNSRNTEIYLQHEMYNNSSIKGQIVSFKHIGYLLFKDIFQCGLIWSNHAPMSSRLLLDKLQFHTPCERLTQIMRQRVQTDFVCGYIWNVQKRIAHQADGHFTEKATYRWSMLGKHSE